MTVDKNVGTQLYAEVAGERRFTAEDLWAIPRVGAPFCTSDGTQLFVPVTSWTGTDRTKQARFWIMKPDGSGSRPLTGTATNAGRPAWSPDGRQLAYTQTPRDGQPAQPQLHLMSLAGGEPEPLAEFPLGVMDAKWLPDGSGLIVVSKLIAGHLTLEETQTELDRREDDPVKVRASEKRLVRFWDQWLTGDEVPHFFHLDLRTGDRRDLTPDSIAWLDFMSPTGQFDIAPDGKEFAFAGLVMNEELNEVESRIFTVHLDSLHIECLTPDAPAGCVRPRYSPDGRSLVYGRHEDRYFYADRTRLYRYLRDSQTHEPWCAEWDRSPAGWEFAADGGLVFTAEDSARTHLYRLTGEQQIPTVLATGGKLGSPTVSGDGMVYYTRQSLQQPAEIFRIALDGSSEQQLTTFTEAAMQGIALGEVREIECTGSGGETVQSFVILPPQTSLEEPAPFVNVVHGGPHGIWGDEFHFRWNAQLFATPGYVVAFPNPQGSTSRGNDYAQRIQGEWGKRPFEDVIAVTDALVESGLVDANRMAAAGGSYGGYMMAWIAGHYHGFRCLVNHAGVYNTLSMYASDATQGRARSFGGDPWSGLEAIDQYNPARFASEMKTPMLVIHGERDYRVPVTQGLECYGVLQAKGIPSRLVHFPDENHWILNPHNSIRWYQEVLDWIDRWLTAEE